MPDTEPPEDTEKPLEPEPPADATQEPAEASPPGEVEPAAEPELLIEPAAGGIGLKRVAEALVFASPKPITTKEIVAALKAAAAASEDPHVQALGKAKADQVIAALAEVRAELEATGRAFQLVEKVSGWVLVSDPACAAWVRQLYPEAKPTRLTGPQLETLAIIAYRQPVTRADIEAVRGVSVDGVMQVLLDRSLVKIAGRAEVPGRPLLYSTTDYFLEHFGLKTTDELPNASELKRIPLPTAPIEEPKAPEAAKSSERESESSEKAPESPNEIAPGSEEITESSKEVAQSSEEMAESSKEVAENSEENSSEHRTEGSEP